VVEPTLIPEWEEGADFTAGCADQTRISMHTKQAPNHDPAVQFLPEYGELVRIDGHVTTWWRLGSGKIEGGLI